jgi:hypothetical protein
VGKKTKRAVAPSREKPRRDREPDWRKYQTDAATYFRAIGLKAEVDAKIQGARGTHRIDVFVTGKMYGFAIRWIIECKNWSTSIPKEKILALQSIVQDVGADRGVLLSEVGFQSGAIRVSGNTNITLTSLADLRANAEEAIAQEVVIALHWRWAQVMKRLSKVHRQQKETHGLMTPVIKVKTRIMFLDSALEDGLKGKFPTVYALTDDSSRIAAHTFEELIQSSVKLIEQAEQYANENLNEDKSAG